MFSQFLEDNRKIQEINNFWKGLGIEGQSQTDKNLWQILGFYFLNLSKNLPFDSKDYIEFIKIIDRYNKHF
jgi:hypothetical protein